MADPTLTPQHAMRFPKPSTKQLSDFHAGPADRNSGRAYPKHEKHAFQSVMIDELPDCRHLTRTTGNLAIIH